MTIQPILILFLAFLLTFSAAGQPPSNAFPTNMAKPGEAKANAVAMGIERIKREGLQVTAPYYDDIGFILEDLDFNYQNYSPEEHAEMLFLNCGTATRIDIGHLRRFVENGGVLYASDLAGGILESAFPGVFDFVGNTGSRGHLIAFVEDPDLQAVIGPVTELHFDLNGWSELNAIREGRVLMRSEHSGLPLMVEVPVGAGRIFYTCFHNHQQSSGKEMAIMKLLIAKQVSGAIKQPFQETAQHMGIDLKAMKQQFSAD